MKKRHILALIMLVISLYGISREKPKVCIFDPETISFLEYEDSPIKDSVSVRKLYKHFNRYIKYSQVYCTNGVEDIGILFDTIPSTEKFRENYKYLYYDYIYNTYYVVVKGHGIFD